MEDGVLNASGEKYMIRPAVLKDGRRSPAYVGSITVKNENGSRRVRFAVKRDLSVKLRSYTLAYRFSPEPVEENADGEPFAFVKYDHANINTKEIKVFSGAIPDDFDLKGCGAYVCEVEYADGTVKRYDNTEFVTPKKSPAASRKSGASESPAPASRGGEYAKGADTRSDPREIMKLKTAVLKGGRRSPAFVESITLKNEDGTRCVKFAVRRDLSIRLRSYTLAYRFSKKPVEEDAEGEPFATVKYDHENINGNEVKLFSGTIPEGYDFEGCGAYVCEIEYEDGAKKRFENTDFVTPGDSAADKKKDDTGTGKAEDPFDSGIEWADNAADYLALLGIDPGEAAAGEENAEGYAAMLGLGENADSDAGDGGSADTSARRHGPHGGRRSKSKKRKIIAAIIIGAVAVTLVGAAVGTYFFGKYHTIYSLIDEGRFTEAYMIAGEMGSDSLRAAAANAAVDHYIENGDLKSAYVFASLTNNVGRVTDKALEAIVELGENAVGSDAFSVAMKCEDDASFDDAIAKITDKIAESGDYDKAMNTIIFMRSESERNEKAAQIYHGGVAYFLKKSDPDAALKFIRRYGETRTVDGDDTDKDAAALISSLMRSGDSASAVFLAEYFGIEYSKIDISAHDPGVRSSLADVYPVLTAEQKRVYHSTPIACFKEAFLIKDGAIEGTDIADAVAVDTCEYRTVVLRADGRVTMLANGGHNETDDIPDDLRAVQVVCGQHHTVALLEDGTCRAFGDDYYGQCGVEEWKDVVSIAAGRNFTVGLLKDGTLVACGSNLEHQCAVEGYNNVVDVFACDQTTVMLFSDGTVHIQGDPALGLYRANKLENVELLSCRANTIVAKHTDGSFTVICAAIGADAGDAAELRDAAAFAAGSSCVAFEGADGKLHVIGDGAAGK